MIGIKNEVCGFFKMEAVDEVTGERRLLADWFPNLITDQGLNRIGVSFVMSNCEVGSGSSPPSVTDGQLNTRVATTNTTQNIATTYIAGPPDYIRYVITYRFPTGAAAGNLSEVGVAWSSTNGTTFSRALIKDGSGNPTTITVLPTEALDVTYEFRTYPPQSDITGSVTITGSGVHTYVARPASVSSTAYWSPRNSPTGVGQNGVNGQSYSFSGSLGPRTGQPSDYLNTGSIYSTNTYSPGSLQLTGATGWGLNDGNANIKSVLIWIGGAWQIEFDPPIQKRNTNIFTLNVGYSWARRP